MQWAFPERWAWALLIPLTAAWLIWALHHRRAALARFAASGLWPQLADTVEWSRRRLKAWLTVAGLALAVVALAGPQWGFRWQEVTSRGVDLMIALDVSKSMLAEDVKPNRLARAKLAIQELLPLLKGDRIGLVAFAGTSFVQCPLTADYGAFALTLDEAGPDLIPVGGTALSEAVRSGLKALEASPAESRALVLITDGEDHTGDAQAAAREAAEAGVHVYCVGIGTPDGELIPVTDDTGGQAFLKDREGRTVKSRLDESTLQQMALATGGAYVRATPTSFGLDVLYRRQISALTPQERAGGLRKQYHHRFQWPLTAALLLLLLEPLLSDRRRTGTVS